MYAECECSVEYAIEPPNVSARLLCGPGCGRFGHELMDIAWAAGLLGEQRIHKAGPAIYLVLVLPYAYRTLDTGLAAIDVKTLSEAARSLGASWLTVMLRVIVPNMWVALLNACLLSVAVVLGEFTSRKDAEKKANDLIVAQSVHEATVTKLK